MEVIHVDKAGKRTNPTATRSQARAVAPLAAFSQTTGGASNHSQPSIAPPLHEKTGAHDSRSFPLAVQVDGYTGRWLYKWKVWRTGL